MNRSRRGRAHGGRGIRATIHHDQRWILAYSYGKIERQAIRRGTFASVRDLTTEIRAFINGWNDRSRPFTWIEIAEETLAKADRGKTSETDHQ